MKVFLLALQFLTCLPVSLKAAPGPVDWGRSVLAYPLIGLLIGGLLAGLQFLVGHADPLLQAALLTAAWALVTGGLHLDGLADSADAWVGGHGDRERTLAIMKDPRSGPAAVTTVMLVLLLKFAALVALLKTEAWPALALAPVLGRSVLLALLLTTPYVRPGGMGSALAAHLPRKAAILTLFLVATVTFFTDKPGWIALAAALVAWPLLRWMMMRRLGGMTGDTLGATVELSEAAILVSLALGLP
ncbi:MAG: adenosylcobinamide-GDP ribazoletransferase [Gammaproteobacteria bacterium]|nr:adenosylcobinamide-GDP ribazoletransferase [Gammaproteobacteria bacterium]MBU1732016.1 adenosylcobinamide-GDP ribazoletransferase [Gammaproteobacteria bacterium]MBU1894057.1 adenosylcobinamide-GDP ribazoletransferase [Gammaproteobacteria bacterium]